MRAVGMLVMHQLTSHGIDPAFLDLFWILAGSIGAVVLFSVAWRVLRLALFVLSWVVIVLFGLVVFGHLTLELW
ncbi:MAG: hypothetical protein OEU92_03070 [Alphaproteobacteria bacterium]|nr:hypothetical protein [Alphaproteobacteria bacterium]